MAAWLVTNGCQTVVYMPTIEFLSVNLKKTLYYFNLKKVFEK